MRFKTLVLIPVIAVLTTSFVSLPVAQNQTSANEVPNRVTLEEIPDRASRSNNRLAFASPQYNKKYAKIAMLDKYGWSTKQYSCLVKLWNHESGWRVDADNPNSSAYGIPQALPGSKMGKGWKTDPHVQINWGLKYIKGRYDTPCGALSAFNKKGWY